jgi:hypothetical protein
MDDPAARERMAVEFGGVIEKLGETGASAKAAHVVVDALNQTSQT